MAERARVGMDSVAEVVRTQRASDINFTTTGIGEATEEGIHRSPSERIKKEFEIEKPVLVFQTWMGSMPGKV